MVIFTNMDESENKFLHKINLETLKKETGKTIEEIAKLVGIGPKVVYKWQYMHKDGSRPDFNAVVKLLQAGASTETLFGVSSKPQQSASVLPPEFVKVNPEFVEGFREQLMEDLMKKGLVPKEQVKDIVRQEIERLLPSTKPVNKF